MRESIAYVHDYIEGTRQEYKKYKPENVPMKGFGTIQLLDGNGAIVKEVKSENIINNYIKKLAYMHYFHNRIKESTNGNWYNSPFGKIYLTTGAERENADDVYIKGDMVGWANKQGTYSGNSTTQGTLNAKETDLNGKDENGNAILHFVFDFPTHCANGTFQSIYWANEFDLRFSVIDTKLAFKEGAARIYGTVGHIMPDGKFVIFRSKDSISTGIAYPGEVYYYKPNGELIRKMNTGGSYTFLGIGTGIDENGHHLHVNINAYQDTDTTIAVADCTNGTNYTLKTSGFAHGLSQYTNIIINGADIYIIGEAKYHHCRREGDLILKVETYDFPANRRHVWILEGKAYTASKTDRFVYEITPGGPIKTEWPFGNADTQTNEYSCGMFNDNGKPTMYRIISNSNDTVFQTCFAQNYQGIGAHNLLPEPITKTAINTMKIQYDFIIETVPTYQ